MNEVSLAAISEAVAYQPLLGAAPASVLLQIVALIRLSGILRNISVVLTVITGAVVAFAVSAYLFDPGNLWEILLILAAPPILVLTLGIILIGCVVRPRPVSPLPIHSR